MNVKYALTPSLTVNATITPIPARSRRTRPS